MKAQLKRRLFILCLVMAMVVGTVPGVAQAEAPRSGICGDNLTWTLNDQGVLTISGSGEMYDFEYTNPGNPYTDRMVLPWFDYRADILEVVVEEGVTSISQGAFCVIHNTEKVTIADTVTSIGKYAFQQCSSLKEITLPKGLEIIEEGTFMMCFSLSEVDFPDILKRIGDGAFHSCEALTYIKLPKHLETIDAYAFGYVGTCRIDFYGEAPEIDQTAFTGVTANVFYPTECESWRYVSTRQDYSGDLTWRNAIFNSPESAPVAVTGDVTGDGKINITDVAKLYSHIKGVRILTDGTALKAADYNGDGEINVTDVARLYDTVKG